MTTSGIQQEKRWMEIELRQPRTSWTIDNHDVEESFVELGLDPVKPTEAGKILEPEEFKQLRSQLHTVEAELDDLMGREDTDDQARGEQ